ncbi:serine hydrolase [Granulicella arctica]|uniref:beta-lactamase n=1 Tax=Granulicella arctica TaxID=940613 RepID=A0A7Y9PJE0_9BACT|nr:serine hydrolase [Granulicella arctica]NYF80941.1 beta-lactamase class A [Granulicella arctica]
MFSASILLAGILFATAESSIAQTVASPVTKDVAIGLQQEVTGLSKAHHGRVAMYAEQLNTGKTVALDADIPVQTASVIKLTVLFEAMEQIRAGKASWDEKLTLAPGDGVSGSGILNLLDAPMTLTLRDVLTLMVVLSDNTATNLAIDRLGLDAINARIAWMGLKDTHLYKKVIKPATEPMPADQPKFGLGKTTPREMARVMERIGRCELAGPGEAAVAGDSAICAVAIKMLRNQFYRDTVPRYLEALDSSEAGSGIASKTGSLNAVRADVAIVAGKTGPMILSIFTYDNADQSWTVDNEAEVTIAKLAKAIVTAWSPSGIDGKGLVPGLGLLDKNGIAASN